MRLFSWLIEGEIAGMAFPDVSSDLHDQLRRLRENGIRLVVSLTSAPLEPDFLDTLGIDVLHLPVEDFAPPTLDQMLTFVRVVSEYVAASRPVVVHCAAGLGRTGTMLAAYLVASRGLDARQAIDQVRALRPGSIETVAQENAVRQFETLLRSTEPHSPPPPSAV